MRAIDTSLLYAFFNTADPHYEEAVARMKEPLPIGIPAPILQETLDLIRYRKGKDAALAAYDYLRSLPHIRLLEAPPEPAVADVWRRNQPLSHADAGAVVTALRENAELLTADAAQAKAFQSKSQTAPSRR